MAKWSERFTRPLPEAQFKNAGLRAVEGAEDAFFQAVLSVKLGEEPLTEEEAFAQAKKLIHSGKLKPVSESNTSYGGFGL